MSSQVPFLIYPENAAYLAARRPPLPARGGDANVNLLLGAVVGVSALVVLPIIWGLQADLGAVSLVLVGAVIAALGFAFPLLRSGWRLRQQAEIYRKQGQHLPGTLTAVELVDEGGGDYFLKGSYRFQSPDGAALTGTFTHYRRDLAGKPLPDVGTATLVLYVDLATYTIL